MKVEINYHLTTGDTWPLEVREFHDESELERYLKDIQRKVNLVEGIVTGQPITNIIPPGRISYINVKRLR